MVQFSGTFLVVYLSLNVVLQGVVHGLDELISARCQAKCLANFEESVACSKPCRETFQTIEQCYDVFCKAVESKPDCYRSCAYLKQIREHKPGFCPPERPLNLPAGDNAQECMASCAEDSNCSGTEKCCTNGCSRKCQKPMDLSTALLPVPVAVTVQERPRGRSAVVRWVMSQLLPEHDQTYANLYLVQWRWGVKADLNSMTPWQTISIRNKIYAILKHILSPGRFYVFRVASVNVHGSLGFSEPSPPFKLLRSPKAPGKPRNLSSEALDVDDGLIIQRVSWLPPTSDLPIVHYQVTWIEAPANQRRDMLKDAPAALNASSFNQSSPDAVPVGSEDNEGLLARTTLVSGDELSTRIMGLKPETPYTLEVHAVVENETGQIDGEKAFIVVKTVDVASAIKFPKGPKYERILLVNSGLTEELPSEDSLENFEQVGMARVSNVIIEKPYYQNGLLKAHISWNVEGLDSKADKKQQFDLTWQPTVCLSSSSSEYSVSKPLNHMSESSSFELYDLQFGCHYQVKISLTPSPEAPQLQSIETQISFETPACHNTPVRGAIVPICPTLPPDVPSPPRDLNCTVLDVVNKDNISAECKWSLPFRSDASVTVFRVIFGQKMVHNFGMAGVEPFPSLDRNTLIIKLLNNDQRSLKFYSLLPDVEYVVQLQAGSKTGLGPAVHRSFFTPSLRVKSSTQSPMTAVPATTVLFDDKELLELIDEKEDEESPSRPVLVDSDSISYKKRLHISDGHSLSSRALPSQLIVYSIFVVIFNYGFQFVLKSR